MTKKVTHLSHPCMYPLHKMALQLLQSKSKVYISTPQIWTRPCEFVWLRGILAKTTQAKMSKNLPTEASLHSLLTHWDYSVMKHEVASGKRKVLWKSVASHPSISTTPADPPADRTLTGKPRGEGRSAQPPKRSWAVAHCSHFKSLNFEVVFVPQNDLIQLLWSLHLLSIRIL